MVRRQRTRAFNADWFATLKKFVHRKPLVLFRFTEVEWESLHNSRRGINQFTFARNHRLLDPVHAPTACFLSGNQPGTEQQIHFGLLKSRSAVTTLETRLNITSAQPITASSETMLLRLVTDDLWGSILPPPRLDSADSVVRLSSAVSVHLVERLAESEANHKALRAVVAALEAPTTYSSNIGIQKDAIALSLKVSGLPPDAAPGIIELDDDRDTALAGYHVNEDAVIEHDARIIPGFTLSQSDLTGRAIFENGSDVLEVITANKRPLEEAFGVDLIYFNAKKENVVMVQYKMLEQMRRNGGADWLYRPDDQLEKEMRRMKSFSQAHAPGPSEFRINPQIYYLRFVKRDADLGKSVVTMPVDHFEVLRTDAKCKGPKGAFRITYDTLGGRYLRQQGFLDLINSGYIGAYAKNTKDLTDRIDIILKGGRSVVASVHSSIHNDS